MVLTPKAVGRECFALENSVASFSHRTISEQVKSFPQEGQMAHEDERQQEERSL